MSRALAGIAENVVLVIVLIGAGIVIGTLLVATWFVQLVMAVADDPNAGPYRQVR